MFRLIRSPNEWKIKLISERIILIGISSPERYKPKRLHKYYWGTL